MGQKSADVEFFLRLQWQRPLFVLVEARESIPFNLGRPVDLVSVLQLVYSVGLDTDSHV